VSTSEEDTATTDSLGRRTGPRRPHSLEEKLQIVKETHVVGASVSTVARRHNVNPNQVFRLAAALPSGTAQPSHSGNSSDHL